MFKHILWIYFLVHLFGEKHVKGIGILIVFAFFFSLNFSKGETVIGDGLWLGGLNFKVDVFRTKHAK